MTVQQAVQWRKASRSAQESACIEVDNTLTVVRDSKNPEPALPANIPALLTAVKHGQVG